MIAIKRHGDRGFVFSSLNDSEEMRSKAIEEYISHEKNISNFINNNKKTKNDVGFYHAVGVLIRKYETENPDDLKYVKERVRFIFDQKQGGLKKDTSKINYCDYCYVISAFSLNEISSISHSCWTYVWQCSNLSDTIVPFFLEKTNEEKEMIKKEGFYRVFGKILTQVLKNVNTSFWDEKRKKIPVDFSYNITIGLSGVFLLERGVHEAVGDLARKHVSSQIKTYIKGFSNPEKMRQLEELIVKKTVEDYNV